MKYLKIILLLVLFFPVFVSLSGWSSAQVKRYVVKQEKSGLVKEIGLYLANSREGIKEIPPNSNSSPEINEFLECVGLNPGNEWCAAFIQWAFRNAASFLGVDFNMIKTGHSLSILSYAKKKGVEFRNKIERGDWIIFQRGENAATGFSSGKGHCGIVLYYDGNNIFTIEGNTLPDIENSNNEGVYKKVRKLNKFGWLKIVGFIGFE